MALDPVRALRGRGVVVAGDAVEEFTATISGLSISAPREDNMTASLDLAISGAMTPVTAS